MENTLVNKAKAYAEDVLSTQLPSKFAFHNLEHTRDVAAAAEEIGKASSLSDDELETVLVSAWLHDIGYLQGPENHERVSAATASALLKEWNAPEKKINDVERTILATKMPQSPKDIMGEVLCDADLYHLATINIDERGRCLRKEFESIKKVHFDNDRDWLKFNLAFFKQHSYFTQYGRLVLQPRKKENAKRLKKLVKGFEAMNGTAVNNEHHNHKRDDHDEEVDVTNDSDLKDEKALRKEIKKLRAKLDKNKPDRGIETMFRTTSANHVTLSGMADTKANIMISINTIILSIIVSVLFRKLGEYPHLLVPTLMLVATCLITIVMSILATRPNVTKGKFSEKEIEEKKANLLFFGNFHNMELKDYEWGMREMMKDYNYLYGSLIKDIYFLGKVLARKYRWLRLAYTIFMFGFVSSILVFLLQMILNYQPYSASDFLNL